MFRTRFDSRSFCIFLFLAIPALAAAQNNLFTMISPTAVASLPLAIATGDFNGDGIMDEAVTSSGTNAVSILLGTGDGNFQAAVNYAVGPDPVAIVAGDFNHDGHLDLAVLNSNPNKNGVGGSLSILSGQGDGTFVASATYGVGFIPTALAAGDFDGDGNLDLAVVISNPNLQFNPGFVTILMGSASGAFTGQANYGVGIAPASIAVGDFNGDGKLDLAVGSAINGLNLNPQSEMSILVNTGSGAFSAASTFAIGPAGSAPISIAAADFNNDGRLDLAVGLNNTNSLVICEGNGDGTFAIESTPVVGNTPVWLAAADFNGDGKIDLIVDNNPDDTVSVLMGNGDETFSSPTTYPTGFHSTNLALADLNGDGKLDVAIVNNGDSNVQVMLGRGDGTFFTGAFSVGANPGGIATGDFNGDGIPDLAVTNGDGNATIFLGDGRGGFTALTPFPACSFTGGLPGRIAAADVNGDGKVDLAILCNITSPTPGFSIGVFQGNGDGTFVNLFSTGNGNLSGVIAADINGDGIPEFVIASDRGILALNLDTSFFDFILSNTAVQSVAAGDFNGDGKTDLLAIGSGIKPGIILLGDGAGNFQQGSPLGWPGGLTGDFNGDGLTDFLSYQGIVQVVLNQGNANFLLGSDFPGNPGRPQALADFDGDGVLDVLTTFGAAPLNVFLGHEDGTFDQLPAVSLNQLSHTTVAVADFDSNGSPDVAALDFDTGTVSILLNKNSFHPTTTMLSQTLGKVVTGGPIALSATVVSKHGTPTGSVTFKQAGLPQTTGSLNNGTALATLTAPSAAGTYGFTALYPGDGTFGGSPSQLLLVTVNAASTTTTVTASASPSKLGQSVTFTATIQPQFSGTPTGTVQFYADGNPIGVGSVSGGQAAFSTAALTMGTHTIEADYSGDLSFTTSLGIVKERVGDAASTVTVTSSANPAVYGQPITITATVTDSAGQTPTGFVVFTEGSTVYGTVSLSGGVAQVTLPAITVGKHTIDAQYSGDSSDAPAKVAFKQTVTGASSSTVVATSAEPSVYGQGVTFTATVSGSIGTPDGTVTFKDGGTVLGTTALSGGQAMLAVSTLNGGTHTINAVYSGNSQYASSSGSVSQIVVATATTTTLTSSENPSTFSDTVTFTATVSSAAAAAPTGKVTIKDGKTVLGTAQLINGQAQISTSLLATGGHTLTATYAGTASFSSSKDTLSQVVQ